jgi:hypothetical protein
MIPDFGGPNQDIFTAIPEDPVYFRAVRLRRVVRWRSTDSPE